MLFSFDLKERKINFVLTSVNETLPPQIGEFEEEPNTGELSLTVIPYLRANLRRSFSASTAPKRTEEKEKEDGKFTRALEL